MKYPTAVYAAPGEEGAAPVEEQPQETPADQLPAENAPQDPPVETPEPAEPEQPPAADASPQEQEDWRDREIRRKHRLLQDEKRKVEDLTRQNADLTALAQRPPAEGEQSPPRPAAPSLSEEEIDRRANIKASQDRFKEKLNDLTVKGEKEYGAAWGKSLDQLTQFGEFTDLPWIMNGVDNPGKVLVELGKNPAEYQRIMDLPPERRQAEYVRISDRQPVRPKPSQAAAPTEAVSPQRVTPGFDPYDDKQPDAQWSEGRKKQRAERFAQRGGR